MNKKGFTLIELLAVITIMGILMLVAIPSISNLINNSRKDTFAEIGGRILNNVRNQYTSDAIKCYTSPTEVVPISGIAEGTTVYVPFGTDASKNTDISKILEDGTSSPFGNASIVGYVVIAKNSKSVNYSISMADSSNHGLKSATDSEDVCELTIDQLKNKNVLSDSKLRTCNINGINNRLNATVDGKSKILCTIN